jgi:hypothetical protein
MAWPNHPFIYEINTWAWLHDLSSRLQRQVTLDTVPTEEWDRLASFGFHGIWLMGVWARSPAGTQIALDDPDLRREFQQALPDFTPADVAGSPYCVRSYSVDRHLGGPDGLAQARKALATRGLRLVLDFVPNHVATDHPWASEHPEYFVQGSEEDLNLDPTAFIRVEGNILARGRDPYFPPWQDVVQLNAFHPQLRSAAAETVSSIAAQCDGMRCDMGMLLINEIFRQTWGERAGPVPATEYWTDVIGAVRARHPEVLFIAEAYWDREWDLQQLGFDYCYDKRLYDRLVHEDAESVRGHLHADLEYQNRLVRFLENHDEPRAASTLAPLARERAAALAISTLPGAKLLHEGQFEGWRTRLPVFLRRRPPESTDENLLQFYENLLNVVAQRNALEGDWTQCEASGWPDNQTCRNLLGWCWYSPEERRLVVINYSDRPAQGRIHLPWHDLAGTQWRLDDRLNRTRFERNGREMQEQGLYVDLPAWGTHYLEFSAGPS